MLSLLFILNPLHIFPVCNFLSLFSAITQSLISWKSHFRLVALLRFKLYFYIPVWSLKWMSHMHFKPTKSLDLTFRLSFSLNTFLSSRSLLLMLGNLELLCIKFLASCLICLKLLAMIALFFSWIWLLQLSHVHFE